MSSVQMEEGIRGVYLRSLEMKSSVMNSSTICLITDSKARSCPLAGKHVQKVKNQFSFGPIVLGELQNYFLADDLLLNTD